MAEIFVVETRGIGKPDYSKEMYNSILTELDIHSAFTWEKYLREGVDPTSMQDI